MAEAQPVAALGGIRCPKTTLDNNWPNMIQGKLKHSKIKLPIKIKLNKFNVGDIISQIRTSKYQCSDLRTDSWIAWGLKQDLYQIKWAIEDAIQSCPVFSPEDEWLKDQERQRIIKILKK